jgi:hypothetical protein
MPRYFFNVRGPPALVDDEGTELPDLATAELEAVRLAGQMLFDNPTVLLTSSKWTVEVADVDGVVFLLRVSTLEVAKPQARARG